MSFIAGPKAKNFLLGLQEGVLKCWKRQDEKAATLLQRLFLGKHRWQTSTIILQKRKKKSLPRKQNFADKVLRNEIYAFISFCSLEGFSILLCSSFIPNFQSIASLSASMLFKGAIQRYFQNTILFEICLICCCFWFTVRGWASRYVKVVEAWLNPTGSKMDRSHFC